MSFALIERFRKDPVGVASTTPILSFDYEQGEENSVIKAKAATELFSVRGTARISAVDFIEKNNVLLMRVAERNVENKIVTDDFMPFFFLPWTKNGIIRTTLRPRSLTKRDGTVKGLHQMANNPKFLVDQNNPLSGTLDPNDPDVFITSSVNGCTVTVRGSLEEPTVYHGNAIGIKDAGGLSPVELAIAGNELSATNVITLKVQDMRRMLDDFERADPKADRLGGPHTPQSGKMLTQSSYQILGMQGKVAASQQAGVKEISKDLARSEGVKTKTVRLASSVGTVFGIRKAGKWKFYYQKLAKFEFVKDIAPWHKKANWVKDNSHPMTVRLVEFGEFWPNGSGILIP